MPQLPLNLDDEIYNWLRTKAFNERRPMSEIIRECLKDQMIGEKLIEKVNEKR